MYGIHACSQSVFRLVSLVKARAQCLPQEAAGAECRSRPGAVRNRLLVAKSCLHSANMPEVPHRTHCYITPAACTPGLYTLTANQKGTTNLTAGVEMDCQGYNV